MRSDWEKPRRNLLSSLWSAYRGWFVILTLGVAAFVLGYMGFSDYFATLGEPRSPLDKIYLVWQLFTLESGGVSGSVPWTLEIARILAPLVTASAALKVILVFLGEQFSKLRLAFIRGHVIVCGLGRKGVQIVEECRSEGLKVVAIEQEEESASCAYCRQIGAFVIVGDATKNTTLCAAQVSRARTIITICGNDGTNIQVAMNANALVAGPPDGAAKCKLECFVQVMSFSMATFFKDHPLYANHGEQCVVRVFNAYENAARQLFHKYPLDREYIGPNDERQAHLIILGIGQMGESVVVHALKLAHFANGQPLRITAFDRLASQREKSLRVRHANLDSVCEIEFIAAEFDDSDTLDNIAAIASEDSRMASIVICSDGDARNVEYALSIRNRIGENSVPIYVRIGQDAGFSKLIQQDGQGRNIHSFGSLSLASSWHALIHEDVDSLARAIHEDYVKRRLEQIEDSELSIEEKELRRHDSALKPWPELAPTFRDSNRQQADHIAVKLRAAKLQTEDILQHSPVDAVFTDEQVEMLARMEHARWNADRLLGGWTLGPSDKPHKVTPHLVPYEELPDEIKEYDREAVRNIPHLLRHSNNIK